MQQQAVLSEQEKPRVLIVDDEIGICRALEGILGDDGFETISVQDGETALDVLKSQRPAAVFLDIWLPGMDGLEVLQRIRQLCPDVPVIMISGHATIATAVKATHLGATDFIEKPLDMNTTLRAVRKAIGLVRGDAAGGEQSKSLGGQQPELGQENVFFDPANINRLALSSQPWRGRRVPQRTLSRSAILYGQGLHSGKKSGLILEPLPSGSGIHFMGISDSTLIPAHVDFVSTTGFATTLGSGASQAGTTEHLMSALHSYGICNLLVKCNGEVPVMDGSATEFCNLFEAVGLEEQEGEWYEIAVPQTVRVGTEKEYIILQPYPRFCVEYTLQYPDPIGRQHFVFEPAAPQDYKREIAPARTFGFVKDIGMLQKQGLAQGGRFDNFVLIGEDGAINGNMRFPDEPVRHKILDVIGDLYLLGRPIQGKVVAMMTGHSDNIQLLRALRALLEKAAE